MSCQDGVFRVREYQRTFLGFAYRTSGYVATCKHCGENSGWHKSRSAVLQWAQQHSE